MTRRRPSKRIALPRQLPPEVRRALRRFAWSRGAWNGLAGLLGGCLAGGILVVIACTLDRLVDVPGTWRLPLTILAGLCAAAGTAAALWRIGRPVDYDQAAWELDRRRGDGRDHLRSAVDFAHRGVMDHVFARWSVEDAAAAWRSENATTYVRKTTALRRLFLTLAFVAAVAAVAGIPAVRGRLLWQRFLAPLGNHMRPTATWFEVQAPPAQPLHGGDDYTLRARLRGRPVRDPLPMARLIAADGSTSTRKLMPDGEGAWQLPLNDLREGLQFVLVMNRVRSARHELRVLPRPTVIAIEATYDYPRYANLKRKQERLGGRTVAALEGTKVRLDIHSSTPLREAVGRVADSPRRFTISTEDPHRATAYLFLTVNGAMELRLLGQNGLESAREAPLQLRVVPDAPPTVSVLGQWEQREYYATEVIEVGYRAQDDLGLMEVLLKSGNFEQEADLESYGVREAQGLLSVPVASLMKPGESTAKFRMLARDGKGQAAVSRELTLRIAVDSYDRQLRLARNSLVGNMDARFPRTCGYPMLARNQGRLEAATLLKARLGALSEALAENAKPGKAEERIVSDIQDCLRRLSPSFWTLYAPWDGNVFDWVSNMPLLPRLQSLVRDALASELALNAPALRDAVTQALAAPNPKAALAQAVPRVDAAIQAQEDVVRRLDGMSRLITVELAGYLAETLLAGQQDAGGAEAVPPTADDLLNAQARLRECAQLVAAVPSLAAAASQPLAAALAVDDPAVSLAAARPTLETLAAQLLEAAHGIHLDDEAWRMPVAAYAAANQPPAAEWLDIYALWALMQCNGRGADELDLLNTALQYHQWRLPPGNAYRPVGNADAATRARHDAALRLGVTLGSLRMDLDALRTGVLAGYLVAGKPEFESLWIRLRESYFGFLKMKEHPALDAGVRNELAALAAPMDRLRHWVPPADTPAALGAALAGWEAAAAKLAAGLAPAVQEALRNLESDLNTRGGLLTASIAAYRKDIVARIAELGMLHDVVDDQYYSKRRGAVFGPMWAMRARLFMLGLACRQTLGVAETARLHHAGDSVDLERLTLASLLLKRALGHFHGEVLGSDDPIRLETKIQGGDMSGKVAEYQELDRLLGEVAAVLDPGMTAATAARTVAENLLAVTYDRECKALRQALDAESAVADRAGALAAVLSESATAPAVWGRIACGVAALRETVRTGQPDTATKASAEALAQWTGILDPLPRSLQALPDVLAGARQSLAQPESRQRLLDELDAVMDNLREAARPTPGVPGREGAQADLLAVSRARVGLALTADVSDRALLHHALSVLEWNRRKVPLTEGRVGIGGLALSAGDDLENLKLPRHLYLELKRAREQAMPELFRDRSYQYLNTLMERAR